MSTRRLDYNRGQCSVNPAFSKLDAGKPENPPSRLRQLLPKGKKLCLTVFGGLVLEATWILYKLVMAKDKHVTVVQTFLGIANIIFLIGGCVLIGIGIWIYLDAEDYVDAWNKGSPYSPSIFVLLAGAIMIVVAFFGCFGAFMKNRSVLMVFVSLVLLLVVIQMILIVLAFIFRDDAEKWAKEELEDAIRKEYGTPDETDVTEAVDLIQKDFECCGVYNVTDWSSDTAYSRQPNVGRKAPQSCCQGSAVCDLTFNSEGDLVDSSGNVIYDKQNGLGSASTATYTKGCWKEMRDWSEDKLIIISSIAIVMLVLQILGIGFGVALLRMTPAKE